MLTHLPTPAGRLLLGRGIVVVSLRQSVGIKGAREAARVVSGPRHGCCKALFSLCGGGRGRRYVFGQTLNLWFFSARGSACLLYLAGIVSASRNRGSLTRSMGQVDGGPGTMLAGRYLPTEAERAEPLQDKVDLLGVGLESY
jgi:hypothetical protein